MNYTLLATASLLRLVTVNTLLVPILSNCSRAWRLAITQLYPKYYCGWRQCPGLYDCCICSSKTRTTLAFGLLQKHRWLLLDPTQAFITARDRALQTHRGKCLRIYYCSITAETFKQLSTSFLTWVICCLFFRITFYSLLLVAPEKTEPDHIHHNNRHTVCTLTQKYYLNQILIQIKLYGALQSSTACKLYTFASV